MDNNNDNEIEQFLIDVREHFRASLETSEYENTSNMFHVTEAETTERLLQRCESLLHRCLNKKRFCKQAASLPMSPTKALIGSDSEFSQQQQEPDSVSYMDMSANGRRASAILPLESEELTSSTHSDKTFRCSTRITTKAKHLDNEAAVPSTNHQLNQHASDQEEFPDDIGDGQQIYDICHVTHQELQPTDETQMVSNADMELIPSPDCPYKELAAAHLGIQKPSKYGQLQRIEKRLFFDQSKKCYCGILEDWLLVYADGPTAGAPAHTLYLKTPGIEIEHSGEGKRRDVCFQITTADPNKKFIFQAANEVDAKEWIHAIEAAIRGVTAAGVLIAPATATINASSPSNKSLRKLPTPPIIKKMNFLGSGHSSHSINISNSNDCIYEEPSPLYEIQDQLGELPEKFNSPAALAKKYEYDVPKCPAKPLVEPLVESEQETSGLLNVTPTEASTSTKDSTTPQVVTEKSSDFQAKIKDVHSKLSSQLSAGPLKKAVSKKTAYSHAPTQDSELLPPPVIVLPPPQGSTPLKEQKSSKKEKKSPATTPTSSPQKFMPLPSSGNSGSGGGSSPQQTPEKTPSKNWFLNRLNKSTSSMRSSSNNGGTGGNSGGLSNSSSPQHKAKQSEKENLLNGLDFTDSVGDSGNLGDLNNSSKPTSPVMRCAGGKSKVNMIINQLEASGHLATMFSVESLANSFTAAFCESDCNNYEPIMTVSPPPSSFLKKV